MEYILINDNGTFGGIVGIEPTHSNWTTTPYLGGFVKEFWNGYEWIESATKEEIIKHNETIYGELDIEYTKKISDLVEKHVQKNIIDGTPIPQDILDERERLKKEFYSLTNKDLKK